MESWISIALLALITAINLGRWAGSRENPDWRRSIEHELKRLQADIDQLHSPKFVDQLQAAFAEWKLDARREQERLERHLDERLRVLEARVWRGDAKS